MGLVFLKKEEKAAELITNLFKISQTHIITLLFYQNTAVFHEKQQSKRVITAS